MLPRKPGESLPRPDQGRLGPPLQSRPPAASTRLSRNTGRQEGGGPQGRYSLVAVKQGPKRAEGQKPEVTPGHPFLLRCQKSFATVIWVAGDSALDQDPPPHTHTPFTRVILLGPHPPPPPLPAVALAGAERASLDCGYVRLLGSLVCWLSGMISMRCWPYR